MKTSCFVFFILLALFQVKTQDDTGDETSPPTTIPPTTTPPEILALEQEGAYYTWNPSEDPSQQPKIKISVPQRCEISVTVSDVNLKDDNYVIIKRGDSPSYEEADGKVITNILKKPQKYLFKVTSVYALYVSSPGSTGDTFKVVFESICDDSTTTTTVSTTTGIDWPTTEESDSIYITVNVSGKNVKEYGKATILNQFRQCVANMAQQYCKNQKIELTEDITTVNVIISEIVHCPYSWVDTNICAQITFRLPIFYTETTTWSGYQLNYQHLKEMWSRYANEFLNNGFKVYKEPDPDNIILWWAIGITVIITAFVVLLIFLKKISAKFSTFIRNRRRRLSDTRSIISDKKDSIISMEPHYLQTTPRLFEG